MLHGESMQLHIDNTHSEVSPPSLTSKSHALPMYAVYTHIIIIIIITGIFKVA